MSRGGATRFRSGQSGNPKGRPRKTVPQQSAFDIVIDRTLTVTQNGEERELTIDEALQQRTYQDAIGGSRSARREVLKMIAKREKWIAAHAPVPKPPSGTRFRPGQSGNPRGRPRGSKRQAPYETVLGQAVTVREDGKTRRMTAAEAFLLHITRRGLEGDGAAARAAMAAIEEARARRTPDEDGRIKVIILRGIAPGAVNTAMLPLRMAVTLDPCRDTARTVIEPWLIEAALARHGERRLTFAEQAVVWKTARTPWKVKWPAWWEYKG